MQIFRESMVGEGIANRDRDAFGIWGNSKDTSATGGPSFLQ